MKSGCLLSSEWNRDFIQRNRDARQEEDKVSTPSFVFTVGRSLGPLPQSKASEEECRVQRQERKLPRDSGVWSRN